MEERRYRVAEVWKAYGYWNATRPRYGFQTQPHYRRFVSHAEALNWALRRDLRVGTDTLRSDIRQPWHRGTLNTY